MIERHRASESWCVPFLLRCRGEKCPRWKNTIAPVEPICLQGHWNCVARTTQPTEDHKTLLCATCPKRLGGCS